MSKSTVQISAEAAKRARARFLGTQTEIAARAKTTVRSLYTFMVGRPISILTARRIAKVFGVPLRELIAHDTAGAGAEVLALRLHEIQGKVATA